jgi:hypothetical protein
VQLGWLCIGVSSSAGRAQHRSPGGDNICTRTPDRRHSGVIRRKDLWRRVSGTARDCYVEVCVSVLIAPVVVNNTWLVLWGGGRLTGQAKTLDLADRGTREVVDDVDLAGSARAGEPLVAPGFEFGDQGA